jgi:hypothetical protein
MELVAKFVTVRPVEVVRKGVEVVMTLPFPSTARNAFVRPVKIVDELKVVVATCVMAAVQVTELAAVT